MVFTFHHPDHFFNSFPKLLTCSEILPWLKPDIRDYDIVSTQQFTVVCHLKHPSFFLVGARWTSRWMFLYLPCCLGQFYIFSRHSMFVFKKRKCLFLPVSLQISKFKKWNWRSNYLRNFFIGAPGWLCQLSNRLQFRSWSRGPWVQAPHRALCWQLRAWTEPASDSVSPSLSAPLPFMLCLSLSQK